MSDSELTKELTELRSKLRNISYRYIKSKIPCDTNVLMGKLEPLSAIESSFDDNIDAIMYRDTQEEN